MQRTIQQDALNEREQRLRTLLVRGQQGDAAAYQQFLTELSQPLRNYLRRRMPSHRSDIEDLAQEVILAVHNARHTYREDQPLTVWVQAIARYKLTDHLRAYARRGARHVPLLDDDELLADEQGTAGEAERDLERLLDTLPERQRVPIVQVKLEGRSVQETAQITGQSISAVKVNIHRGLKALAGLIRRKHDDEY
ncbi:sigma-70 family RNA polymerase sigma factor [Stutzerimonas azotifigens]|uniref:Sigma-70 family RNA polymerase sigma factor n=1 Tax=Stutzerimonas azotifigens TaxID=291995 RepID=A0ABR5Z3H6_9GAMM|nr:sigma-70 family RNA polymerase sigma factor [Stutzerimonas azotifigens]MBA1274775.1 sigma-70 family RNA polymerase sigma factor [Stutzerimonas azotifigens]